MTKYLIVKKYIDEMDYYSLLAKWKHIPKPHLTFGRLNGKEYRI